MQQIRVRILGIFYDANVGTLGRSLFSGDKQYCCWGRKEFKALFTLSAFV